MRPAPLVLARPVLAVLVAPDRDVLRTVIGSKVGAPQSKSCGSDGEDAGDQLLGRRAEAARFTRELDDGRAGQHRRQHRRALEGQLRLGQRAPDFRDDRDRLEEPCGAA